MISRYVGKSSTLFRNPKSPQPSTTADLSFTIQYPPAQYQLHPTWRSLSFVRRAISGIPLSLGILPPMTKPAYGIASPLVNFPTMAYYLINPLFIAKRTLPKVARKTYFHQYFVWLPRRFKRTQSPSNPPVEIQCRMEPKRQLNAGIFYLPPIPENSPSSRQLSPTLTQIHKAISSRRISPRNSTR